MQRAPARIAAPLAPWAGAALAGLLGGYPTLFAVLAALSGASVLLALGTAPKSVAERPGLTP
ncbi:hypothetical protein ACFY04_37175 [Streptomyces sp. NPDC001549]|uniref:hypothetical protein n=1 Tax=Streptomyces sp. NPDC001549 TaxID=3364586 RepID=UPI003695F302